MRRLVRPKSERRDIVAAAFVGYQNRQPGVESPENASFLGLARRAWVKRDIPMDWILHLDRHLNDIAAAHPQGIYAILIAIIFCETGLVVWPFLPGDSLLFATGALAASAGSPIHLPVLIPLLCLAANAGDLLNFFLGRRVGPAIFHREDSWLLNKKHLREAHAFYERNGRKTIILARFVPIIRTFAPFVAGIGKME